MANKKIIQLTAGTLSNDTKFPAQAPSDAQAVSITFEQVKDAVVSEVDSQYQVVQANATAADAPLVFNKINVVTSEGSSAFRVIIPSTMPVLSEIVVANFSTIPIQVFPPAGATISGDTSVNIPATRRFIKFVRNSSNLFSFALKEENEISVSVEMNHTTGDATTLFTNGENTATSYSASVSGQLNLSPENIFFIKPEAIYLTQLSVLSNISLDNNTGDEVTIAVLNEQINADNSGTSSSFVASLNSNVVERGLVVNPLGVTIDVNEITGVSPSMVSSLSTFGAFTLRFVIPANRPSGVYKFYTTLKYIVL